MFAFDTAPDRRARQRPETTVAEVRRDEEYRADEVLVACRGVNTDLRFPNRRAVAKGKRRRVAVAVDVVETIERIGRIGIAREDILAERARVVAIPPDARCAPVHRESFEAAFSAAAAHELSTARVLEAAVGSSGRARNTEPDPSGAGGVGSVHRERAERAARRCRLSCASRSVGQNLDDAANRRVPIQRSAGAPDRFDASNSRGRHDRPVDEPRFDIRHRYSVDQQADVFGLAPAKESARGDDGPARIEIRPRHVEAGQKPKNFRRMCGRQRDERRLVEHDIRGRDESSWCLAAFGSYHDLRVEPRRVGRRSL